MKAISFDKLVEELAYCETGERNLGAGIKEADRFFENLDKLEAVHTGPYCFLAFHPLTDAHVAAYVESGSLASDAGPDILALFLSASSMKRPKTVTHRELGIGVDLDLRTHPAYEFTGWLFPAEQRPALPGIIFFDRLFDVVDAVFVSLAGLSGKDAVAERCREVLILAEASFHRQKPVRRMDFDDLCASFDKHEIPYSRTGAMSFRAWLRPVMKWLKKHGGDLVAAILKKAIAGK